MQYRKQALRMNIVCPKAMGWQYRLRNWFGRFSLLLAGRCTARFGRVWPSDHICGGRTLRASAPLGMAMIANLIFLNNLSKAFEDLGGGDRSDS